MKDAATGTKNEARRAPRHPLKERVEVSVTTSAVTTRLRGRSVDFSQTGMGCLLTEELKPGQRVTAEFSLPLCPDRFRLNAVVRYNRGSRHGLEFTGTPAPVQEKLNQVCEVLPKFSKT